jgi:major membrane immunogen (membrane-anchored lipoprotein)
MRKITLFSVVALVLMLASCKRDHHNDNEFYNYNLTFWTAENCSPNPITVTVDSQTAQIIEYYPNNPATCGSEGCANFYLPAGTYYYTASNIDTTWQDSVVVTKGGCTLKQFYCSTGYVTFWVDSAPNGLQVVMDNGIGHVNTSFPTTTPTCGTAGCANFTMHPGTYTYTATTASNVGYTGSVTVQKDSCKLIRLY